MKDLSLTDEQLEKFHNLESSGTHHSVALAEKFQEIQELSRRLNAITMMKNELAARIIKENGLETCQCSFQVVPDSDRNGLLDVKLVLSK